MKRRDCEWGAASLISVCLAGVACGGAHTDGDGAGGTPTGGSSGGGEATGGESSGGSGAAPGGGGDASSGGSAGGGGPSIPEGCIPLIEQPDGSYVADARIEETDPLVFFDYQQHPDGVVEMGSHTERFCGIFENYDRLEATALPGPAPAIRNIILKGGPSNFGFTAPAAYARVNVELETDAPLGAPIVHEFQVGGIRSIFDLGNVRLVVKVVDRLCDYDPAEAPVYGEDGYIDARESHGFYGSYFPRGTEGVRLCDTEFRGETACISGLTGGPGALEVVQHVAQQRGGEPQLWTPPPEYVGIGFEQQAGGPMGITDGETIWWADKSGNASYTQFLWNEFKTSAGVVYAREPITSVVQRSVAVGRVTFCALTTEPVLAAGARPDCQMLVPGENHLLLYGDRYSAGLACLTAEEGQLLTFQFIQAVPEFGVSHLGPESSYFGPSIAGFHGEFSEADPTPTATFTAVAGLNAFRIASHLPNTQDNTPVILNFTITDP